MTAKKNEALANFLKTRRARLTPEQVGLSGGQRRRTQGLRREEVAQIAGVSVTWYTWLEQGRSVGVSLQVLESIARALQLSLEEKKYLFVLANKDPDVEGDSRDSTLSPVLQAILDHQNPYPAYILGRYWDIPAWNRAASGLFGDFSAMRREERNLIWYMFARPETRQLVTDWPGRARRLLAEFRADTSHRLTDPELGRIIERLKGVSPEFDAWWTRQDVFSRSGGRREFEHPLVGHLVLEQTTFQLSGSPEIKLVLHIPSPEADSAAKLIRLAQA
jgi:transcriptional regulator with XRE-family HTH domain